MSVPFAQIGPGQVGRLAYQVIGKDGPIFNPTNIAYLDPGDGPQDLAPATYGEATTALAGINLAVASGSLVLSAATLKEVHKLQKKVDAVLFGIERLDSKVTDIARRVARIDMRVAENNLREAMRHVLSRAVREDEIDLRKLSALRHDLQNLFESLEQSPYMHFGIRLATDVRENLTAIHALLAGTRMLVAQKHNQVANGMPDRSVSMEPTLEYLSHLEVQQDIRAAILYSRVRNAYGEISQSISQSIATRFSFSDDEDHSHFSSLLQSDLADPLETAFSECFGGGRTIFLALPEELFEEKADDIWAKLSDIAVDWLWNTDSGLLMRTDIEMAALTDGYDSVFWPHLNDPESVPIGEIRIDCALPPP